MNDDLRNRLWTVLCLVFWNQVGTHYDYWRSHDQDIYLLVQSIWINFLKLPIDDMPHEWHEAKRTVRDAFFAGAWNRVYDLLEFIALAYHSDRLNDRGRKQQFINACNSVLEQESSAYRFVGDIIARLTSDEEITAINDSLSLSGPLTPVRIHIQKSLELLSSRTSPDYRNSIKESVSAVEAAAKIISGESRGGLSGALTSLERSGRFKLHGALRKGLEAIYGWTSDADGIRHALMEEPGLDFEDAKFMLVSCAGFSNYLIAKVAKVGVVPSR